MILWAWWLTGVSGCHVDISSMLAIVSLEHGQINGKTEGLYAGISALYAHGHWMKRCDNELAWSNPCGCLPDGAHAGPLQ